MMTLFCPNLPLVVTSLSGLEHYFMSVIAGARQPQIHNNHTVGFIQFPRVFGMNKLNLDRIYPW